MDSVITKDNHPPMGCLYLLAVVYYCIVAGLPGHCHTHAGPGPPPGVVLLLLLGRAVG